MVNKLKLSLSLFDVFQLYVTVSLLRPIQIQLTDLSCGQYRVSFQNKMRTSIIATVTAVKYYL